MSGEPAQLHLDDETDPPGSFETRTVALQAQYASDAPVNAMSVDVEDYFQVSAFEQQVSRAQWEDQTLRVERNTDRILQMFDDAGVKSTFFTLGWVAERCPQLIQRIVAQGHELASHGYDHTRVYHQRPDEFRADIEKTRAILEDTGGVQILGYRAASYSIVEQNLWALDILAETGHQYSSSIYPIRHDLYGIPSAPRFAFRLSDSGIREFPITTLEFAGKRWPFGGGGFFRLFPYALSRFGVARVNNKEKQPAIFYFHPWEIDPDQPRMQGISAKARFRHYLNLNRTEARLSRLLADFRWAPMAKVFGIQGKA